MISTFRFFYAQPARERGETQKIMQGAFSDLGQKEMPYYYPCTYCSYEEECGIDDKEDCEGFRFWFDDYCKEEDCIICRKVQELKKRAENLIQ